jgi:polyribonucleotide nucleotidyltransferase
MPKTKKDDPAELLRLAVTGLDDQIAELQEIQTQLAAMVGRPSASLAVEAVAPQKRRKLSAEAREKIGAAAKTRWARERKAKVKAQKAKPATEKAKLKGKPAKSRPALAKKKKSSAK